MKTIKEPTRKASGGFRLPYLENEEGMFLVLTMVILLVLSSIAATNIINAYLERSLARNQHYASVSLNAADSGIDYGLTWLNANGGTIPDHTVTPGWTQGLTGALPSGGDFIVTMRFKPEDDLYFDADGDTDEIVLYNSCPRTSDGCWGFPGSIFKLPTDPAFPVIEIRSEGGYGEAGRRVVTLDVARNGFDVKAYGAVTAASNVNLTGNINVDGRAHDETGALCPFYVGGTGSCSCGDAYPGVTVEDGFITNQAGTADNDGVPAPDQTIGQLNTALGTAYVLPFSPADALGIDNDNAADDQELAGMFAGGTLPAAGSTPKVAGNITYVNDDYSWNVSGTTTGILIVHNPLFDPRVWAVSRPTIPDPTSGGTVANPNYDAAAGNYDEKLDPTNAAYDAVWEADHAPRTVDQHGNGTFKGVVIADRIDKINGDCTVIGAMISLTAIATNILGNGTADIVYSCDAINLYTTQTYGTKISWRRHYD